MTIFAIAPDASGYSKMSPRGFCPTFRGLQRSLCPRWQTAIGDGQPVTAHDGFTLRDCVCFNQKHNEANGEENRDGTNNNYSNNHGIEGLEANFAVIERRRASAHALLTTLLLAQGTPMLLAGDEQGHSQHGNNNAYCRDNALTWLDWRREPGLTAFTRR